MRIVFFNRFFFPDASATSQILTDLTTYLAECGHEIDVVTSKIQGASSRFEVVNRVRVHRVGCRPVQSHGMVARVFGYSAYYRGARILASKLLAPGTVAVVMTDPPLLSVAVARVAEAKGVPTVLWLQDIFPEIAAAYGVFGMRGAIGSLMRNARDRSLKKAAAVVTIADGMASHVSKIDLVDPSRIHVIHNWADGNAVRPLANNENRLRNDWKLQEKFIVEYSGNLGRVHEFETVLKAALRLRSDSSIRFLFIGGGPRLAELRSHVDHLNLANVQFKEAQPRGALRESLGLADVHLSILRSEFEGLVQPSKLYGIMAAGRPIIFIGSKTGETARILDEAGCGITVPTGDGDALADEILRLKRGPDARAEMGRRARDIFAQRYDMPIALEAWASVLEAIQFPTH